VTPGDAITLGPDTPMPWPDEAILPGWQILRIGREPDNGYPVNSPIVSAYHARLIWNDATGEATIEDLGSSNGTAIGAPDRKIRRAGLPPTETLYLGTHPIPARVLLAYLGPARLPSLTFRGREMTVGRDPGCDLMVDLAIVSGRHARLTRSGDLILIEDLGSSNGTYVNGQRIDRPVVVKPGDRIRVGSHELELALGEGVAANRGTAPHVSADVPIVTPPPVLIPAPGRPPSRRRGGRGRARRRGVPPATSHGP
jgi:pSer/pThr/pTyr-binding forkhead associated (FHA) protein